MGSRSPSPSEGEIVSSDSEAKANTKPSSRNYTNVDRQNRPRHASRDAGYRSSRSRSRSPYRAPRGEKRRREDDHPRGPSSREFRTFNVRYDDRRHGNRRGGFHDEKQSKRARTYSRSRSPSPFRHNRNRGEGPRHSTQGDAKARGSMERSLPQPESRESAQQSDASSREQKQVRFEKNSASKTSSLYGHMLHGVRPQANIRRAPEVEVEDAPGAESRQVLDEAALIEERRKRREAIKNKYRGQATPLLVQALHLGAESSRTSLSPDSSLSTPRRSESPISVLSPKTPRDPSNPQTPTSFEVENDQDVNSPGHSSTADDGPSAADYDPKADMEEERSRHDKRLFKEDDASIEQADNRVTGKSAGGDVEKEAEAAPSRQPGDFDMFADEDDDAEDDMFAEAPMKPKAEPKTAQALAANMMDNWDDHEGYYITILGELLQDRYHVTQNLGKGMFSSVVRATDSKTNQEVAIKIVRNNETMRKAGVKEMDILKDIAASDPDDKKHLIRLHRSFDHKGHLCMVFENLSMNLREVLKKFGRDVGINIKAIRAYAQQLFLGLGLLRKCQYLHADLKPDNILVNEARSSLKICDLGSASPISENATAPYLVSRFYRAPEVILGIPYDYGIDMWSIGCTLFELYTGKILFTGRNNNGMLRAIMECRGKFPHKLLRRGALTYDYFDDLLNFRSQETDKVTGRIVTKLIDIKAKPVKDLRSRLIPKDKRISESERKEVDLFVDLLDKCLDLRPDKRITPNEALKHPFVTRMKP